MFKISKDLISDSQNPIRFNTGLDINIREDYRYSIKMNDPKWAIKSKNITIRIIGTRYAELSPLYGTFYYFEWRKTAKGGADELDFSIPECPTISNSSTVTNVCYKHIASQTSGGGTHALKTYMILSPQRGTFEIGKHIKISNETLHTYIYPVSVTF
jgi:hypothetical protein